MFSNLGATEPSAYMRDKEDFTKLFRDKMSAEDYESVFGNNSWYKTLLTYVAEKSVPPNKVESTKAALSQVIMGEFEKINSNVNDMTRKMVRFACFTTKPNNLPMWHHYTNGHNCFTNCVNISSAFWSISSQWAFKLLVRSIPV